MIHSAYLANPISTILWKWKIFVWTERKSFPLLFTRIIHCISKSISKFFSKKNHAKKKGIKIKLQQSRRIILKNITINLNIILRGFERSRFKLLLWSLIMNDPIIERQKGNIKSLYNKRKSISYFEIDQNSPFELILQRERNRIGNTQDRLDISSVPFRSINQNRGAPATVITQHQEGISRYGPLGAVNESFVHTTRQLRNDV